MHSPDAVVPATDIANQIIGKQKADDMLPPVWQLSVRLHYPADDVEDGIGAVSLGINPFPPPEAHDRRDNREQRLFFGC
jgi:hypothetical protein